MAFAKFWVEVGQDLGSQLSIKMADCGCLKLDQAWLKLEVSDSDWQTFSSVRILYINSEYLIKEYYDWKILADSMIEAQEEFSSFDRATKADRLTSNVESSLPKCENM